MKFAALLPFAVAGAFALPLLQTAVSAETVRLVPAPRVDAPRTGTTAVAVLAGGCFWGLEGVFEHVAGVRDVVSGYSGGAQQAAQYEIVGTGVTGHAESVRITYDPAKVSYGDLLRIYFSVATDPTQLNRQGPDSGTQYRSTIFAQTPEQAAIARAYIAQLKPSYDKPIVTTIETGKSFYPAEAYHQNFMRLNPTYGYIVANDAPKVAALKRLFPQIYRG
jgi:peptide-methionine (S)-S-oxide reductase